MTENERKLNGLLEQLHDDYVDASVGMSERVARDVAKTRLQVVELIEEYANKDDTISRSRVNTLLRDLEAIEREIRTVAETSLAGAMKDSVEIGYANALTAFHKTLGLSADFVLTARVAESLVLPTLTGKAPSPSNLAEYLAHRTGPDGLILSDRVWQLAGEQRAEMGNVLRRGIIRGDSTSKMVCDIRTVYENEAWKARRLALTEANTAYRTAIGYTAEKSKFVSALRLVPGVHHSEKCVAKAGEDRHGLGAGIFLPSDSDIYSIHPNCTAYTQFILTEEVR
ncbi:hypothetical protein [Paenibacillus chibensis]|uniref:hypothetical protein n=1 Tax=Paenibacillus chibensis TaxID=59846 RepID=UPI000FDA9653|nr:hypothetical protein [Paenibacillus chibensis]MEC0370044.1 hypothetical protein [Paenibacillus chibensis]